MSVCIECGSTVGVVAHDVYGVAYHVCEACNPRSKDDGGERMSETTIDALCKVYLTLGDDTSAAALLDALLRERGLQAIPASYEAHTVAPYMEYYWAGWGLDDQEEITIYAPPLQREEPE